RHPKTVASPVLLPVAPASILVVPRVHSFSSGSPALQLRVLAVCVTTSTRHRRDAQLATLVYPRRIATESLSLLRRWKDNQLPVRGIRLRMVRGDICGGESC